MVYSQKIWWPITAKIYAESLNGKSKATIYVAENKDKIETEKSYSVEELI